MIGWLAMAIAQGYRTAINGVELPASAAASAAAHSFSRATAEGVTQHDQVSKGSSTRRPRAGKAALRDTYTRTHTQAAELHSLISSLRFDVLRKKLQ